ncbi:MAG TPA: alpha/beta fold hydrolase [Dehalococcoidia bacterium]|nr:alpha/beta fold hydrolase [Dehalococcoidia bacterium]
MMEQEVSFKSEGLSLSGTLAMPDSGGPFPAVLFIAGSGQVDRNENHKKYPINLFREFAGLLAGEGIASLRYDKRGVGASEGDFWSAGFSDNTTDARSALDYVRSRKEIKPGAVFLLGHSEGALIAVRLAGQDVDASGAVLLSGAAQRGEDILRWQAQQVAAGVKGLNGLLIKLLRIDITKAQQKQLDKIKRSTRDTYRVQLIIRLNAKWMREFIDYDPSADLSRMKMPALAITGSNDIQTDPSDMGKMAELVTTDFEYHEVPGVTHILRYEEGPPTLSTYKKQVKQPMDSRIPELVLDWLKKRIEVGD